MAINERLVHTASAAAGGGAVDAEQGLVLHLDANDVDSYDGDGSIWYDISTFDKTIPISDNADDLELHLNASDTNSYSGTGTAWTDLTSNNNATVVASTYDIDNGGYFDITSNTVTFSSNTSALDTATFSLEMWVYQTNSSGTQYLFSDAGISLFTISGTQMRFIKGFSGTNNDAAYLNPTANGSGWAINKWNHIAVTLSSFTSKTYINGVLVHTEIEGSGTPTALTTLQISPSLGRWKGYLGAFRVYDIALSASEVGQNYRHGRDYVYTDLIPDTDLALHFDAADLTSASNTTWTDKANSVALTKSGTVAYDDELGDWVDFGSGYYGNDTDTTQIKDSNGDSTVEFWYNFDQISSYTAIVGAMQDASNRGLLIGFHHSYGMFVYNYKDGTMGGAQFAEPSWSNLGGITYGKWYHVVIRIDASTDIQFYINGEKKFTSTSNAGGSHWNTLDGVRFGDMETISYTSDGQLGQIRFYKKALTADEIRQNFNFTKSSYPNGFNATNSGATFSPSTTPNYWSFDGSNDSMLLSTTSTLLGNTNNVKTISGFITLSSTTARGFIYSVSSSNNADYYFYIGWLGDQNKVYVASRNATATHQFLHTAPLTGVANTWKHICVTGGDGNTPKIYVNGVELTVTSSLSGTATSASWIDYPSYSGTIYTYLAKLRQTNPASSHWHNGRIGQVKLYGKTLTSAEVLTLFNAEKDIYGL